MLVLRKGGEFTDRQINKHLWAGIMYFALLVLAVFAVGFTQHTLIGLLIVVLATVA
jgi:hypothetical protein